MPQAVPFFVALTVRNFGCHLNHPLFACPRDGARGLPLTVETRRAPHSEEGFSQLVVDLGFHSSSARVSLETGTASSSYTPETRRSGQDWCLPVVCRPAHVTEAGNYTSVISAGRHFLVLSNCYTLASDLHLWAAKVTYQLHRLQGDAKRHILERLSRGGGRLGESATPTSERNRLREIDL